MKTELKHWEKLEKLTDGLTPEALEYVNGAEKTILDEFVALVDDLGLDGAIAEVEAIAAPIYAISTAKGSHEADSIEGLVAWQREHRGAWPSVEHLGASVYIDDLDIDDPEIVSRISALLQQEEES